MQGCVTARHCVYDRHGEVRQELKLKIDGIDHAPIAIRPAAQVRQTIDVAALEVPCLSTRRGIPTQLRLPQIGEEVAAIGFPRLPFRSSSLVLHVGTVEALPRDYKGKHRFIQVSFQSGGGLSGGCLIDKSGHALGIMTENIFVGGNSRNPVVDVDCGGVVSHANRESVEQQAVDGETKASSRPADISNHPNGGDTNHGDVEPSGLPRPYGQAVPMEYLDSFIHEEDLTLTDPIVDQPGVFAGVPPKGY